MRFKANVRDSGPLSRVLQALSQQATRCVVLLSARQWKICLLPQFTTGELVFGAVPVASCFENYRIESKAEDRICVEVDIKNLLRAFRSTQADGFRVAMRLTKKSGQPYLAFEIMQAPGADPMLTQDVPVDVQPAARMLECEEPDIPAPGVRLALPPLRQLRGVIDRVRRMDGTVLLALSSDGELGVEVQTPSVTTRTCFTNLGLGGADPAAPKEQVEGRVAIPKLTKALSSLAHLLYERCVVCMAPSHAIVIYAELGGGPSPATVACFLPLIIN